MKKVLVTGINGFIGSNVSGIFLKNGYDVFGWDFKGNAVDGVKMSFVDLREYEAVKNGLLAVLPDYIIHCAGCADVGKSVVNPQIDFKGNVIATHNLLFAVHAIGLKRCRIIFLSSAAVYGTPDTLPISEKTSLKPVSPYALHKVMSEQVCHYFFCNYQMDIKIVRIFSAYGKGLKKQIFWDMFCKAEQTGKLQMFGTGKESRDYIHIEDLVSAIYLVAAKAPKEENIYNIANGEEVPIYRVAEMFADIYGIEKEKIEFSGFVREGEPINWKADIKKLLSLGYKKSINIEQGIEGYIQWVKKL